MTRCPNCGQAVTAEDRFCPECGTSIAAAEGGGDPIVSAEPVEGSPRAPEAADSEGGGERRWRGRELVVIVIGVVAFAFVAYQVFGALARDGGGASSPEGAVRDLAQAINEKDPVAALLMVSPAEVRGLDGIYEHLEEQTSSGDWVDEDDPLAGADAVLSGLELDVEQLSEDVAKVNLLEGSLETRLAPSQLAERVRSAIPESDLDEIRFGPRTVADLRELLDEESSGNVDEVFLIAVRDDGRWYVSPSYTGMEYLRLAEGLPPGDFSRELDEGTGADSPEGAVQALVDAANAYDPDAAMELIAPSEAGAVLAYGGAVDTLIARAGGAQALREEFEGSIEDVELSTEESGDVATVTIESSRGAYGYKEYEYDYDYEYGEEVWRSGSWEQDGLCGTFTPIEGEGDGGCVTDVYLGSTGYSAYPDVDFLGRALIEGSPDGPELIVVEEDGRWYVSPVRTISALLGDVAGQLNERSILMSVGRLDLTKADGTVEPGAEVSGTLDEAGLAVYEIPGDSDDFEACYSGGDVMSTFVQNERLIVFGRPSAEFTAALRPAADGATDARC